MTSPDDIPTSLRMFASLVFMWNMCNWCDGKQPHAHAPPQYKGHDTEVPKTETQV